MYSPVPLRVPERQLGDGTLFPPTPVYVPNAARGGELDEDDIAMIQKQRELGTPYVFVIQRQKLKIGAVVCLQARTEASHWRVPSARTTLMAQWPPSFGLQSRH